MNSENISSKHSSNDEVSIKDLTNKIKEWVKYLASKWIMIVSFSVLGGVFGFVYSLMNKPIYVASTTFVLEAGESKGGLGQYAGIASMVGLDIDGGGGGIFQGENILELYRSRTMIEKTLLSSVNINGKTDLLINYYIDFNGLRNKWEKEQLLKNMYFIDNYKSLAPNRLKDSILGTVVADLNRNYLSVGKPDKKLSIIKVDVKAKNEVFAKTFNDAIVKQVNEFYIKTKTKKSLANLTILQHKTDSVRSVMNGEIYLASSIIDATPNLNPTRQTQRAAPVQRSQFSAETNKMVLGELVKNLELSKMALLKETPLVQVLDQPIYPLEKLKVGALKGTVMGWVLFGFITILYLTVKRVL